MSPVTGQAQLRVLRLRQCPSLDANFTADWPDLTKLQLADIDVDVTRLILERAASNLRVLSLGGHAWNAVQTHALQATGVECLELAGIRGLRSLTELGELPQLRRLRLVDCPDLASLDRLNGFPDLEHLELIDCTVLNLHDRYVNTALKSFTIVDCPTVVDAKMFAGFPQLREVTITGVAKVLNPGAFTEMTRVQTTIDIHDLRIGARDNGREVTVPSTAPEWWWR